MQDYRAYILGPDGHVGNRVDLRCDDDGEAIRLARQLVDGRDVEEAARCRRLAARINDADARLIKRSEGGEEVISPQLADL